MTSGPKKAREELEQEYHERRLKQLALLPPDAILDIADQMENALLLLKRDGIRLTEREWRCYNRIKDCVQILQCKESSNE